MPLRRWNKTSDVGVASMNDEHREILDAMNQIDEAHAAGAKGAEINELLARLAQIVVRHFADKEQGMEQIAFPGLAARRIIHQRYVEKFTQHAKTIKHAGGVAAEAFFGFLTRWLTAHIHGVNAKYGEHANPSKTAHRQATA